MPPRPGTTPPPRRGRRRPIAARPARADAARCRPPRPPTPSSAPTLAPSRVSASTTTAVDVPAIPTKIALWSARRMRRQAGADQRMRWKAALVPNMTSMPATYTASAALAPASGPAAIRNGPATSHATKAPTMEPPPQEGPSAQVVGLAALLALGQRGLDRPRHSRPVQTVGLLDLAAGDPEQEQDGVEVGHAQCGVGGAAHERFRVEGDAEPGHREHVEVVGAVAHRHGAGQRHAGRAAKRSRAAALPARSSDRPASSPVTTPSSMTSSFAARWSMPRSVTSAPSPG